MYDPPFCPTSAPHIRVVFLQRCPGRATRRCAHSRRGLWPTMLHRTSRQAPENTLQAGLSERPTGRPAAVQIYRKLVAALILCFLFMILEVVGGFIAHRQGQHLLTMQTACCQAADQDTVLVQPGNHDRRCTPALRRERLWRGPVCSLRLLPEEPQLAHLRVSCRMASNRVYDLPQHSAQASLLLLLHQLHALHKTRRQSACEGWLPALQPLAGTTGLRCLGLWLQSSAPGWSRAS